MHGSKARRLASLGGALLLGTAAAPPPLEGKWSGDRTSVSFDRDGATIVSDCAHGRIQGPVRLDASGRFSAAGSFDHYQPGPQRADVPTAALSARFTGNVQQDAIDLRIKREGEPARHVVLRRAASVKFVRCL